MSIPFFENALWQTLSGPHREFSIGNEIARRYLPTISPFAAIQVASPEAFLTLERLAEPEESLVIFSTEPLTLPEHWDLGLVGELITMVLRGSLPTHPLNPKIQPLGEADVDDMLALTALTRPGPFKQDTIKLGAYFGVRINGRLAAMAGERARLPGHTEISAVCTHPDFQGQGLARDLVIKVAQGILERGETPMLRVICSNNVAIRVYQKLGFEEVDRLHFINFHPRAFSESNHSKELQTV